MPEKEISASQAREAGKESMQLAQSSKEMYEVSDKDLKGLVERLQKEPMRSLLVDHLDTFSSEHPNLDPGRMARLTQVVNGTIKDMKAADKPVLISFLKHFAAHVEERTTGTLGRGNAWKDLK